MNRSQKLNESLLREMHIAIETYLGKDDHSEERDEIKQIANNNRYDGFVSSGRVKSIMKNIQETTYAPLSVGLFASYMGVRR